MSTLSSLLGDPKRQAVIADLAGFVESTVASQSGITGMAMKGALTAATKVNSNIVHRGLEQILPGILGDLEPKWQEFESNSSTDFGAFLSSYSGEVTDTVLRRTDAAAEKINVPALAKTYTSLRGKAEKLIEANVPELGRLLQKHM